MYKFNFTLFLTLVFYVTNSLSANLCAEVHNSPVYSELLNIDSQKMLRKSWSSLFKSDDLVSFSSVSAKETDFLRAESGQVSKSLPSEIQEAIRSYTEISGGYGGHYESINSYLRQYVKDRPLGKRNFKPSLFPNSVAEQAKLIEMGILQTPTLPEGLLLFRGLAIDPSLVKVGEPFSEFGFMSTSLDPVIAYQFARVSARNYQTPHLFIIEIKAKNIHGFLPTQNNENEVLLQRGVNMRVQTISERTMDVTFPGIYSESVATVPFRIVYMTADGP